MVQGQKTLIFSGPGSKNIDIYTIDPHEKGPTFSILKAQIDLPHDSPIIISYCDFTIEWDYERFKRQAMGFDSAVPYFSGFQAASLGNTKYAYMMLDGDEMLELKETGTLTKIVLGCKFFS